jgi:ATP diphosphatase
MNDLAQLLEIMAQLRDPQKGCPWDLKQNFSTIVPHTIEEAYEVAFAIEQGDFDELRDELGDLLFQVVFYSQLAKEQGLFEFSDVVSSICEKMLRRHPHVFDDKFEGDTDHHSINARWDQIKKEEKSDKVHTSVLDGITKTLPAMTLANKMQKRASRVGFDWNDPLKVIDKIEEELEEVREELKHEDNHSRIQEEIGDLLFACVNLARHVGADPEQTLRHANEKFEKRFRGIEREIEDAGKDITQCTLEELEACWVKVKEASDN